MNPLYQTMSGNNMPPILQQFQQFRNNFKGDPQQAVQQLLNSGRITQEQYNQAVQTAQQLSRMMGMKF